MKKLFLITLISLSALSGWTQVKKAIQISGVVVATDSLIPVPYATIYRSNDKRGTFADYNGYFTMPALVGDTIYFTSVGLKNSFFIIPDDSIQTHISIVQWMELTEILLPEVVVRPYPSPGNLRRELLALDLPGDRYYRFSREAVNAAEYDGLADLSESATNEASDMMITRYTSGFKSGGNLLDAAAWGNFVKALKRSDRKK
jgi:hypothetical protein